MPGPTVGPSIARCSAATCQTSCDEAIARLRQPVPGYLPTYKGGRCVLFSYYEYGVSPQRNVPPPPGPPGPDAAYPNDVSEFKRPGCECLAVDAPENNFQLAGRAGATCLLRGRVGECALDLAETPTCTPGVDDRICSTFCQQVATRIRAAASKVYDAQVHGAACQPSERCACVARVDDQCYDLGELNAAFLPYGWSSRHDCARSVAEIARTVATECSDGCGPGRVCLFGHCAPPPAGPCMPGTCPDGQVCFEKMRGMYCPDCPVSACLPRAVCETLSPSCKG
jgi:hypothetical protein